MWDKNYLRKYVNFYRTWIILKTGNSENRKYTIIYSHCASKIVFCANNKSKEIQNNTINLNLEQIENDKYLVDLHWYSYVCTQEVLLYEFYQIIEFHKLITQFQFIFASVGFSF